MAENVAAVRIERHFATVGERQVHYRRAGHGPPVILLHEAPLSSLGFEPLMRELAPHCTVIAPDTPGNGLSEPLGIAQPTMTEFAQGLAALLDELGIERCVVYGYHSGAQCALEFALRHPQRVMRLMINGYLALDEALRQDIVANYFAPLSVDWSGSHLTWLWSRMREQWDFFPWYRKALAFRPPFEPPSPAALHQSVLEMLAAGDAYRDSYRAAFQYDTAAAVQQLTVPTLVTTPRDDILFPGLATMPPTPACVRVQPADDLAHAERMLADEVLQLVESLPEPPPPRTRARATAPWSRMVRTQGVSLHIRTAGEGDGRPVVLQHSTVESTRCVEALLIALAAHAQAIAIDLPGRGASESPATTGGGGIELDATVVAAVLADLDVRAAPFVGWRGGASVGLELAARADPAVGTFIALQPLWPLQPPDEAAMSRFAPELLPDTAGTHLLRAWHQIRDQELYEPWHDRRLANVVRHHEPDLDPQVVQHRLEALFRCGPQAIEHWRSALQFPWRERLARAARPVIVGDATPALATSLETAFQGRCTPRRFPQADTVALATALVETFRSLR